MGYKRQVQQMTRTVAERRKYRVTTVKEAKRIASEWLNSIGFEKAIKFGLPEIDDRYHIWRIALINHNSKERLGEIVIDANTSLVNTNKTTKTEVIEKRLLKSEKIYQSKSHIDAYPISPLRNTIAFGDSKEILPDMPADSIDLIFTSPPYYNARPEYTDYITYEEYLLDIRKVIQQCRRVLIEGRFFVINVSPVLLRRVNRNVSSQRLAVPFDFHKIFIEEGFDFIDDIIWVKPEGAGWATSRGRRFAADRNPLQYKAVPVTEYVLVYRKKTDKLIDWFIRNHPNRDIIKQSKIKDDYERTNVWKIHPAHDKKHPAVFPVELAEKVIKYYSFKNDVILDPFAGVGTVGEAAIKLGRRFVLIDINKEYVDIIREKAKKWIGRKSCEVLCVNCASLSSEGYLL
jgi:DNA modification methylase